MTAVMARWAQDDSREQWTTAEEGGALPIQSARWSTVGHIGAHGPYQLTFERPRPIRHRAAVWTLMEGALFFLGK